MREDKNQKQGLIDLVYSLNKPNLTLVEIGSYAGESAEIFANTHLFKTIICIDPWEDIHFINDSINSYTSMKNIEQRFDAIKEKHNCIKKFKGTLKTFVKSKLFKETKGTIDVVYIDGLHTFIACLSDIQTCQIFIKPKLAYCGHDYTDENYKCFGVKKAVNTLLGKPDKIFCDTSWLKFVR